MQPARRMQIFSFFTPDWLVECQMVFQICDLRIVIINPYSPGINHLFAGNCFKHVLYVMNDHHLIPLSLDSSDAGFGLSFFLDEIVIPKRKKKKEEEFFLSSHPNIKETKGQRGRMFCLDSSSPL